MTEQAKLDRLDAYLATNDLESIWFAAPPMFAWLTGGDNLVAREGDAGVAAAGYDGEAVTVVTSTIEGQRLLDEEIDVDVRLVEYPWHEEDLEDAVAAVAPTPAAADVAWGEFESIDRSAVTQPLTDGDVERYRDLGRETAVAVEEVALGVSPASSERELAGRLHYQLQRRGIDSPVVLVGGADRLQRYRHFTPTDVEVGSYAVLTVVGVRHGLNAAVTRTVAFDNAPDWLADRYADVSRVAATAAAATRRVGVDNGTAADIFEPIRGAYEELGYVNEWENHHQGGALGYASREWTATPGNRTPVELPMAFGWNPTVEGAKSEDTVLVTADGVEVLSTTGEFPTLTADAVGTEFTLTLPDVLWM
ncbi:M24 family metallopeptidase [Haloprofundus halobius]|uniref:M24 family metallopeptidase n=1 Tax=Haloprofundus halobius TaxID=2876194 RepID=UPI001CCDCDF5|nr:M24 family metallopeptidase [Haloprofundus halobius]